MESRNRNGFTQYFQYSNYWRHNQVLGSIPTVRPTTSRRLQIGRLNKWQIFHIVTAIVAVVGLVIAFYNVLAYDKCTKQLRQLPRATNTTTTATGTTPHCTTVATTTGRTTTLTTTTAPATTTATTGVTNTSAIAPEICQSGWFPYGHGDLVPKYQIFSFWLYWPFKVAGQVVNTACIIDVAFRTGRIYFKNAEPKLYLTLDVNFGIIEEIDPDAGKLFYFRQVTSEQQLDIIRCLVNDSSVDAGFVFTWVNVTITAAPGSAGTFQCILAFVGTSKTYAIRNYSSDLTNENDKIITRITVHSTGDAFDSYKASDILDKRLITDMTEAGIQTQQVDREEGRCGC